MSDGGLDTSPEAKACIQCVASRGLQFGLARERFAGETLLDKDSFDLVRVTVKPYYDDRNGPPTARHATPTLPHCSSTHFNLNLFVSCFSSLSAMLGLTMTQLD